MGSCRRDYGLKRGLESVEKLFGVEEGEGVADGAWFGKKRINVLRGHIQALKAMVEQK